GDRRDAGDSYRLLPPAEGAPALGSAAADRLVSAPATGAHSMEAVFTAIQMVASADVLLAMIGAALFGLFVGAVPGLTATMATALLVPITFFLDPIPAVAVMVTATAMAIFAG